VYWFSAQTTIVYITPAASSLRLSRLAVEKIVDGSGVRLKCAFLKAVKGKRGEKKRSRKERVNVGPALGDEQSDEEYGHDFGYDSGAN
jgi:hypothetical protein